MRKHNEGYVLPLVLVVMVILSLIAVGVMSVSLRNLQTQKADIERMKAQYAAQGEIEKLTAQIEEKIGSDVINTSMSLEEVQNKITEALENIDPGVSVNWASKNACDCVVKITATKNNTTITCELGLYDVIVETSEVYMKGTPTIQYISYKIGGVG